MRWRYRETVLALCTTAFLVTMVGRLAISPVVPDIATEFDVSNTLIGAALTGMWVAYALTQFPSGILADRFGERRVILASVAGTGLTVLVIAASSGFGLFVFGVVFLGAAAGLHYTVATTLLTRTYEDIGTAIGIHNAGAPLAGLLTPVVVSWIAVSHGWQSAIAFMAVLAIPTFVLIHQGIRPTEPRRSDQRIRDSLDLDPIVRFLSRPPIVFTGILAVIGDFTWQALASFMPTFFVQYHQYSQTTAGTLFAVYFVVQGVLQIGVGAVGDRFGRDIATGMCMVTSIVGLSLLITSPGLVGIVSGVVLLGLGMGWSAAVFPRFMDHLSEAEKNSGFGLVRTVYMVVAASGSVVVGFIADHYGWSVALSFLIALLTIVCGLLVANYLLELEN